MPQCKQTRNCLSICLVFFFPPLHSKDVYSKLCDCMNVCDKDVRLNRE